MKQALLIMAAMTTLAAPAMADEALAKAKNCMACHAVDKKLVGPAYKDVAKKYAGDAKAADKLAEKIRIEPASMDELIVDLHHSFKRRNGYSELEISQKRTALEKVMRIDSLNTHSQRLMAAGFTPVVTAVQALNFVALLAIKPGADA